LNVALLQESLLNIELLSGQRSPPLTAEPRRRAAVGVDCESWSDSAPSSFRKNHELSGISLLNQAGINRHPDLTIGIDFVHAWQELLKILEFQHRSSELRPTTHIGTERKLRSRTLTSNQIFLGIIASPRIFHMIQVPMKMNRVVEPELAQIEENMFALFGRGLSARDLESRVHVTAPAIQIRPPESRTRAAFLRWLHENWTRAAVALCSLLAGAW
jgi:hypothetical protein